MRRETYMVALLAEYLDSGGVAGERLRRMLIEYEIPYNKHYNDDNTDVTNVRKMLESDGNKVEGSDESLSDNRMVA